MSEAKELSKARQKFAVSRATGAFCACVMKFIMAITADRALRFLRQVWRRSVAKVGHATIVTGIKIPFTTS